MSATCVSAQSNASSERELARELAAAVSGASDPVRGGFVSTGPEAERVGMRFDTSERGNGNAGHDWGVTLSPEDKAALVEYMKTL